MTELIVLKKILSYFATFKISRKLWLFEETKDNQFM